MATLRNDRSGDTITTDCTNVEAAAEFARLFSDRESWLWFWIHTAVQRERERNRAPGPTGTPQETASATRFLGDLFIVAMGQGLKRPMIRLHYKGRRFKWYLSARGTLCLKTGALAVERQITATINGEKQVTETVYSHDPVGDEEYAGCAYNGRFSVARNRDTGVERPLLTVEREFLDRMRADPVGFISECGKDMGRCCYCNQPLEDPTSKRVGYGKTCAGRYGLPWGDKAYMEKAPSFAKLYDPTAAAFCGAIRQHPETEEAWAKFGDWLEEHGLPRCKKPKPSTRSTAMPRT